ncbi:MAG: putative transrane efflux protein [Streptosporangiaceae bacterium]|nr:putative transrane efflux protein [Streptosporangiaceae bacterium]
MLDAATFVVSAITLSRISRVSAYDWLASLALNPLGMALAGPLASALGITTVMYGAAALIAVSCVGVLAVPDVRRLRSASARPAMPVVT